MIQEISITWGDNAIGGELVYNHLKMVEDVFVPLGAWVTTKDVENNNALDRAKRLTDVLLDVFTEEDLSDLMDEMGRPVTERSHHALCLKVMSAIKEGWIMTLFVEALQVHRNNQGIRQFFIQKYENLFMRVWGERMLRDVAVELGFNAPEGHTVEQVVETAMKEFWLHDLVFATSSNPMTTTDEVTEWLHYYGNPEYWFFQPDLQLSYQLANVPQVGDIEDFGDATYRCVKIGIPYNPPFKNETTKSCIVYFERVDG